MAEKIEGFYLDGTEYKFKGGGTSSEYNAGEGIEIKNGSNYSAMQGPAPDGFHVPLSTEWQGVKTIMDGLSLTTADSWRINLHMPFAGFRGYGSGGVGNQGSNGRYWSSSPYSASTNAYYLYLSSNNTYVSGCSRADGLSVRCFKDSYVAPTSSWTVIQGTLGSAGIFWNQSEGLISITNGTTGYTMMDKNLGATTVYSDGATLSEANCGKYYQWGNNYGFAWTGKVTWSDTKVNASTYGPGNYYSGSTFITGSTDWSSVHNDNLRGGETGVVTYDNVINNTGVLSVNGQTGDVTIASPDMSNYLAKNNTTAFTPTGDYQPATKKYVDDNAGTGSEQNLFIITEDMVTVSTNATKGVAPYNTSYGYTNINIDANAGIKWKEGAIYTFVVNTKMVVDSAYRNVRVKIGNGAYIPVMATTAAVSGNAYFTKTSIRQFQYTTKYESGGALHVFTDSNTTYKAMTEAQATAGTATTALTISPSILKGAITTHETVKSGDSGKKYIIKVSTTAPASGTASNIITIVTD